MPFSEAEIKRHEKSLMPFMEKRRPPDNIRDKIDLSYRIEKLSIEIFLIRPLWNKPETKIKEAVARATFVKSRSIWNIYWMRADLKWHLYSPKPEVKSLKTFLRIVDEDKFCCFWG